MRRIAIWVVFATLMSTVAVAQTVTTGTLEVTVTDPDGAALPGALVSVSSTETVTAREIHTDGNGQVTVRGLVPSASYIVEISLDGFSTIRREPVLVRSGQTTSLDVAMRLSSVQETVSVTAASPLVDTKSAITGQDITLQLTESLPTARSYQDYLQLVPGVMPDDGSGNPASKSGLNYSDIGGTTGVSRDNFYYFNGINVTDPVTGTFGANLNTEIIQEQNVVTGGIPAEYSGTPGLLTTVITKSGSNTFHGSANYFFQNDSLVGDNDNLPDSTFNRFDAAVTLGGPIINDRAWFFGSYRRLERDDDVVQRDTGERLRTVDRNEDQGYFKGTVSPTGSDTLSVSFLNDPLDTTGSDDPSVVNNRDSVREQGGPRFEANYAAAFGNDVFVDLGFAKHNGEVSNFAAIDDPRNDIIFRAGDERTLADEQLGGAGFASIDERDITQWKGNGSWTLERHDFKLGGEFQRHSNFRNQLIPGDATYLSLASHLAGTTLAELEAGCCSSLRFAPGNTQDDFDGFMEAVAAMPDGDEFIAPLDLNGDGTLTAEELSQYQFSSTAGNPDGRVNYNRNLQVEDGPLETKSEGISFFVQDTWQLADRFVLEAGLRAEEWSHFAATGQEVFTFDWTLAPRASLIWDVMGDGRHALSAFYGIYYDPIRGNMTNFAGSIGGRTLHEQVFINDRWVSYRIRGGSEVLDAAFAPTTETPWTEDLQLDYTVDLGRNISASATYTKRRTRDILEDYNPGLYLSLPENVPDSLHLGLDYYGFDDGIPENVNFIIATLAGGERDYQGIELVLRKRYSDNWQGIVSYTYNDATGNTVSDSNADLQGDIVQLDPRAPGLDGRLPGSISHLFKAIGSYTFDFGLTTGGVVRWNSGSNIHRAFEFFGRDFPLLTAEPFEFAGINQTWVDPAAYATVENPSWTQVDLRVQYVATLLDRVQGEFFVDVFNVFDDQSATRVENLDAGSGQTAFGDPVDWINPRRFFLGARLSF